jgi:iron(III) transport system substrate-binding protein
MNPSWQFLRRIMRRVSWQTALALATLGFVAGCSKAPPAAKAPESAPSAAGQPDGFASEWARLQAAARAEGELVIVAGSSHSRDHRAIFDTFSREFGIKVIVGTGSGAANVQRVMVERSRGRFTADISMVGTSSNQQLAAAGVLAPLRPLFVHPEVVDRSRGWRVKDYVWLDTQRTFVAATSLSVNENVSSIYYNSERVSPDELAKLTSWQDFLRPEWQGRIVAILEPNDDGKMLGLTNSWRALGREWFTRFMREAKPVLLPGGSLREVADGLARGKYHVALFISEAKAELDKMQAVGLPVRKLLRTLREGGEVNFGGAIAVFDRAPHGNAARLFLNWYLSRAGQNARHALIDEAGPSPSLRSDVDQGKVSDYDWHQLQTALPEAAAGRGSAEWAADAAAVTAFLKEMSRELRLYGH